MSTPKDFKAEFAYRFKMNLIAMIIIIPFAYAALEVSGGQETVWGLFCDCNLCLENLALSQL